MTSEANKLRDVCCGMAGRSGGRAQVWHRQHAPAKGGWSNSWENRLTARPINRTFGGGTSPSLHRYTPTKRRGTRDDRVVWQRLHPCMEFVHLSTVGARESGESTGVSCVPLSNSEQTQPLLLRDGVRRNGPTLRIPNPGRHGRRQVMASARQSVRTLALASKGVAPVTVTSVPSSRATQAG